MKSIKIFQVDAFTNDLFKGNPAAVCIFDSWPTDKLMQNIAAENNLAETAFIVPNESDFEIRWFTPLVEVDLCGHATLASAFVLFNYLNFQGSEIVFHSPRSGILKATNDNDKIFLEFPSDILTQIDQVQEIIDGIGIKPIEVYKGKSDYMAVVKSENDVLTLKPNFEKISMLKERGLIVTAPGVEFDFVSRFFAPQAGINEDPVTGSAHTTLVPYWSKQLGKKELIAKQLSKRTGILYCENEGAKIKIAGHAKLYLIGEIFINDF